MDPKPFTSGGSISPVPSSRRSQEIRRSYSTTSERSPPTKRKCQALSATEKVMVFNVYNHVFKTKFEEEKRIQDCPGEKVRVNKNECGLKTSEILGISRNSVYRLLKEEKENSYFSSPEKHGPRTNFVGKIDEFTFSSISRNVHVFFHNNEVPTVEKDKLKNICYITIGGSVAYQVMYMKKDFNGFYDTVLGPCARFCSPEFAHNLGVTATKYGLFPEETYKDPDVLKTKFLSYELNNPIGIAAGFDKDGKAVVGLRNLGFSIVEIGSVTPEPQPGNPKPRVFRLPDDQAIINRYGFNSEGHDNVFKRLLNVNKAKMKNGVIGVNLGKNKSSENAAKDYVAGIEKFGSVADYFVINVSSPNTPGLRALQNKDELKNLLIAVNNAKDALPQAEKPPIFLKLSPDLSKDDKYQIVQVITRKESRVDGLIVSNTTIERPQLTHSDVAQEAGGLSGRPLTEKSTEMIREMYKITKGKIPIIGVGGVFTGKDAYEKILAGASAVQIYTAFIYHGPPVVTRIKSELSALLSENGFKSVAEAVGKGVK